MPVLTPVVVVDFETEAIETRPKYPPEPVGVAIMEPGKKPVYLAWGHPTSNNCTKAEAARSLARLWSGRVPLLFHNGQFDMEVALEHFGLPLLPHDRWHDSLITAYLRDPHAKSLALKTVTQERLGIAPDERDELRDWILENVPEARRLKKNWGAFICKAPGDLVGKYAKGDCTRTLALFSEDWNYADTYGMLEAYERERRMIPILLTSSRRGIRVDAERLAIELPQYSMQLAAADQWIRRRLKCDDLNIDSTADFAKALDKAGKMSGWLTTKGGARSTSRASIEHGMNDKILAGVMRYREALNVCINTFMMPWQLRSTATGGFVQVDWNSTRQDDSTYRNGTRSGRLSSTPNFQNIYSDENLTKAEKEVGIAHLNWLPLPRIRGYIMPDEPGHVLCDRDFSQQELRVLADFEEGLMMQAYREDPTMDLHDYATEIIKGTTGIDLERKQTKTIAFGLIYGMGVAGLAAKLGVSDEEATNLKEAYLNTFPGVRELMKELKWMGKTGESMRTWGGRRYHAEAPKIVDNRMRSFEYKLINYLVQGSSADITKEAIIRYDAAKQHGRFVLTVHDEIVISVPKAHWKSEMAILKEAMNGIELDVPMLSDGTVGERWTGMEECE